MVYWGCGGGVVRWWCSGAVVVEVVVWRLCIGAVVVLIGMELVVVV